VIAAAMLMAAALASGGALASSSSLEPAVPRFGDRVVATATVVAGDEVDAGSLHAVGGFGPLEIVSAPLPLPNVFFHPRPCSRMSQPSGSLPQYLLGSAAP